MKRILFFIIFLAFNSTIFADSFNNELYINNRVSGTDLYIRFYPISGLYTKQITELNVVEVHSIRSQKYTPGSGTDLGVPRRGEVSSNVNKLRYIVGLDGFALANRSPYPGYFKIEPDYGNPVNQNKWLLLGHDATANGSMDG